MVILKWWLRGLSPKHKANFRRFYVSFSALQEGFKKSYRSMIYTNGCFLKGQLKGELLVELGRDGNNPMYPIAWAMVEVENKET